MVSANPVNSYFYFSFRLFACDIWPSECSKQESGRGLLLEEELKEKAKEGAFWGTFGAFLQEGLLFIFGIIMGRLILSEEFGLFSTVSIYTNIGSIILQLGLPVALIQRKALSDAHIKTAYTATLTMAALLILLMWAASPWLARAYGNPQMGPVVIVASLIFFFNAAYGIPNALLTRHFQFKRLTIISFAAVFLSGTIAVVMAAHGFGVWSLVESAVGFSAVICIPAIWLCGWRPRLGFNRQAYADLARLGTTVMFSNLVLLLSQNADQLVISGTLGFGLFGLYGRAYGLIILPLQKVSTLVDYVAFPAYTKIQDQPELLKSWYLKSSLILAVSTYPMIAGLAIVAPEFLPVIFGAHWIGAALPMRILGIATLIMMIHMMAGSVFVAMGQARAYFICQVIRLILMTVSAWLGSRWGLAGVCWAVCVGNLFYFIVVQRFVSNLLKVSMVKVLQNIWPPLALTGTMIAAVLAGRLLLFRVWNPSPLVALGVSLLVGVTSYGAAVILMGFKEVQDIYSNFWEEFKKRILRREGSPR
ncbi:MAG: lipopolysaccharide biosynthesis protein [Acidobacteria bacterium]|nr:lipopolysaccharide biosynthesis protein [Acidobacteriota bacterium]MBI3656965.1 lipopolysaccharide biosynthesis protein [Acidobacteriota bacterium]